MLLLNTLIKLLKQSPSVLSAHSVGLLWRWRAYWIALMFLQYSTGNWHLCHSICAGTDSSPPLFKCWWSLSFALLYFCRFSPVSESTPVGTPVGMILAAAVNTTVFYSIVSGNEGGEFSLWREFTKPVCKCDYLTQNRIKCRIKQCIVFLVELDCRWLVNRIQPWITSHHWC